MKSAIAFGIFMFVVLFVTAIEVTMRLWKRLLLVGLAFALLLHLLSDLVQQKETDFLDECNDYCHAHVVSKLRVRPKEGNPE